MRRLAIVVATAAVFTAGSAPAAPVKGRPHVDDSSLVLADGTRILRESTLIRAPRDAVWRAFATTEGMKSWEAPVAEVDLKVGGHIEASYDPKQHIGAPGNIRHEILGFLPGEILVFRNTATPPGFHHADLFGRVTNIMQIEDAGGGMTRLTLSGVGYGSGKDWDELYDFFHAGNAWLFEALKAHFEGGPGPTGPAHTAKTAEKKD